MITNNIQLNESNFEIPNTLLFCYTGCLYYIMLFLCLIYSSAYIYIYN